MNENEIASLMRDAGNNFRQFVRKGFHGESESGCERFIINLSCSYIINYGG
jgi:hypothetical protein